eukprot:288963_1
MSVSWSPKFMIGDTINIFNPTQANILSPFTENSVISYRDELKEIVNDARNIGKFDYKCSLANNLSTYAESLNIVGKLDGNVGIVGAEAEVNWCKNQNMTSNDIRLVIQASYTSNSNTNVYYNTQLKLAQEVMDEINNFSSFSEFKKKYGTHLIIGLKYGTKVIYLMTYKCKEKKK